MAVNFFDLWQLAEEGNVPPRAVAGVVATLPHRSILDRGIIIQKGFFPVYHHGEGMLLVLDYEQLYRYNEQTRVIEEVVVNLELELEYERQDGSKYTTLEYKHYLPCPVLEKIYSKII
uniref:Uncharacterized protein n=1 Tax=Oryza punctata TaxID=4537 RepID=A0A0E0KPR0_ORYPU